MVIKSKAKDSVKKSKNRLLVVFKKSVDNPRKILDAISKAKSTIILFMNFFNSFFASTTFSFSIFSHSLSI